MSKLYFKYGTMGSSKTANALMCKFNYEQVGYNVLLIKPQIDTRDIKDGEIVVKSRIGLYSPCLTFDKNENLYKFIFAHNQLKEKSVVIVDEAHFCTTAQINELKEVSRSIPVLCYGLLTNFKTELFEGSKRLVEIAESLMEIKAVCPCGKKATVNARFNNGKLVLDGEEVCIGGDETYKALCYNCYNELKKQSLARKKLLLHSCCAPCTSGVLWQLEDYDITLLFYNPNIDTLEEYNRRLDTLKDYVSKVNEEEHKNIEIIAIPYDHNEFTPLIKGLENEKEGGDRCKICFSLRLDFTAKYAKEHGFDLFASTLSVSPHKDFQAINDIGSKLGTKYDVEYLPSNFKKNNGYLISIQNSKKYGLYRQNYCGCKAFNNADKQ